MEFGRGLRLLVATAALLLTIRSRGASARPPDYEDSTAQAAFLTGESATISCHGGEETLQRWITLPPTTGSGGVLAIPAITSDITVSLDPGPIVWQGEWPSATLTENVKVFRFFAAATQLYPLAWMSVGPSLARSAVLDDPTDVRRFGLRCRVVRATSANDLAEQAAILHLTIDASALHGLQPFCNSSYSFLLVVVEDAALYDKQVGPAGGTIWTAQQPAAMLTVRFPAVSPVLPARVATSHNFEDEVAVRGFYTYQAPPHVRAYVSQYIGDAFHPYIEPPYHGQRIVYDRNFPYTRIHFSSETPLEMHFTPHESLRNHINAPLGELLRLPAAPWIVAVLWAAGLSYLSAGVAGLCVYRRWRGFARAGFWNLATVLALRIRVGRGINGLNTAPKANSFILCFTCVFLLLCYLSTLLPTLLLGGAAT